MKNEESVCYHAIRLESAKFLTTNQLGVSLVGFVCMLIMQMLPQKYKTQQVALLSEEFETEAYRNAIAPLTGQLVDPILGEIDKLSRAT